MKIIRPPKIPEPSVRIIFLNILWAILSSSCSSPSPVPAATTPGDSDRDIASYEYGRQIGSNLLKQNVLIQESALSEGFHDAIQKRPLRYSPQETQAALQRITALAIESEARISSNNASSSAEWLKKHRATPGVLITATGLQYEILKQASGPHPTERSRVKIKFRGSLVDGTPLDPASSDQADHFFYMDELIAGWQEALKLMSPGMIIRAAIPPELAYGNVRQPNIPPQSVLLYTMVLEEIESSRR